ncbi:MAG: hypothetical protein WDA27_07980 [Actinomycetota bacterium]
MRRGARWLRPALAMASLSAAAMAWVPASTGSNVVPGTRAGAAAPIVINPNALKPSECASLDLQVLVTGGVDGGNGNDLMLGTVAVDSMSGGKGDDCLLGGGGGDSLNGGAGYDVCIGGPGTDSFHPSCEVQIQ